MRELQRRTLALHPMIITAAYAGAFANSYVLMRGESIDQATGNEGIAYPPIALLLIFELFVLWWLWSLYAVTRDAIAHSQRIPMPLLGKSAFALAVIGHVLLLATGNIAFLPLVALPFIASNWLAADALVKFETRKPWLLWWRALVTFLAIFYLPIGIWFLRPRIERVLAAA